MMDGQTLIVLLIVAGAVCYIGLQGWRFIRSTMKPKGTGCGGGCGCGRGGTELKTADTPEKKGTMFIPLEDFTARIKANRK